MTDSELAAVCVMPACTWGKWSASETTSQGVREVTRGSRLT